MRLPLPRLWPRTSKARRASRDPHWDNIRYFSGVLVVFGHAMDSIADRDGLRWLYIASWAMRVPVFVMVAGYFSSAGALTPREGRRLIESILLPYLAIGLLHTLQRHHYDDGEWTYYTVEPAWGLWFLLSLLFWRAGLPYLAQLRYPLATSVVVALLAGYIADIGSAFSFSRTLTFLPFFLLGWRLRQGLFREAMRAPWSRYAALGVLALTFTVSWSARHDIKLGWLFMKGPYGQGHLFDAPFAWTTRAAVLAAGAVIALAFIRLVPRRNLPVITYLGAGGLTIYLLHPLVLRPLLERYGVDWVGPWPEQAALLLFAIALASLLATPPVRWLARPLVQPRIGWLFRPETAPRPARPESPSGTTGTTGPAPADTPDTSGSPGRQLAVVPPVYNGVTPSMTEDLASHRRET
ncbi:hypothetical protein N0X72_10670 [Streptomyces carpaticus]|uniref:acyltransferase family protein n=1 Tax=Streptomyces TaxID=1883 RepID=UPI00220CD60C|nr:hypothetical protein N0X72_10670 [Streptomyces carpaticus]